MTGSASHDYEVDRQRHVRALAARLPSELQKVTWPLERLHTLRDERLRALVHTSKQRSPWHAQRLHHIDVDSLRGDDLSAIPPMTKADLLSNWDEIVTDSRLTLELANAHLDRVAADGPAYLMGEYHVVASGGASGTRAVFPWDFGGWLESGWSCSAHPNGWTAKRVGRASHGGRGSWQVRRLT